MKPEDVARYVVEQSRKKQQAVEDQQALSAFPSLMDITDHHGDFPRVIAESKKHIQAAPHDGLGYYYLGLGNYYNGDFGAALAAWKQAKQQDVNQVARISSMEARATRILHRFPGLKLGPIHLEESDAYAEKLPWFRLGKELIQARNYDEIERVTKKLQMENRVGLDGKSLLRNFLDGLEYGESPQTGETPDLSWQRSWERLQQWKKARPGSVIASVAQLETQTRWAGFARGSAYASEVTEEQWAGMKLHLEEGQKIIARMPAGAAKFPLTGPEIMGWGLFAQMPASDAKTIWDTFNRQFPGSLELASAYCINLLPRWSGAPGEWEKLASSWADQAPGETGDIRYAQLITQMAMYFKPSAPYWSENNLNWPRTRRGLRAMLKKHPQSLSVATALLWLSMSKGDWASAQDALIHHVNNRAHSGRYASVREFALLRLSVLDPGH